MALARSKERESEKFMLEEGELWKKNLPREHAPSFKAYIAHCLAHSDPRLVLAGLRLLRDEDIQADFETITGGLLPIIESPVRKPPPRSHTPRRSAPRRAPRDSRHRAHRAGAAA